jgi:hypothetical protein
VINPGEVSRIVFRDLAFLGLPNPPANINLQAAYTPEGDLLVHLRYVNLRGKTKVSSMQVVTEDRLIAGQRRPIEEVVRWLEGDPEHRNHRGESDPEPSVAAKSYCLAHSEWTKWGFVWPSGWARPPYETVQRPMDTSMLRA